MDKQKFEITNPEAIKLISDVKSGQIFAPVINFLKKYRWHITSVLVLVSFLIAITVGKYLSGSRNQPYTAPVISGPTPTVTPSPRSSFDSLKKALVDFSTVMPEPAIPPVDEQISLEPVLSE